MSISLLSKQFCDRVWDNRMRLSIPRLLTLAAGLLLCAVSAQAAPRDPSPCIGLAHIPICRIDGTSMGSIVGGLYAAGYSSDEMANVIGELDWKDLLSDDPDRVEEPIHRKDADYRYLPTSRSATRTGISSPRPASSRARSCSCCCVAC
jgi:hypothetical protein